mmetsp:Transcript_22478/g.45489  ORF Transcript_22478/g.45489 Transcript_22478/m.45489 type:complete len:291 (-) Transcript_22478:18-890(-)
MVREVVPDTPIPMPEGLVVREHGLVFLSRNAPILRAVHRAEPRLLCRCPRRLRQQPLPIWPAAADIVVSLSGVDRLPWHTSTNDNAKSPALRTAESRQDSTLGEACEDQLAVSEPVLREESVEPTVQLPQARTGHAVDLTHVGRPIADVLCAPLAQPIVARVGRVVVPDAAVWGLRHRHEGTRQPCCPTLSHALGAGGRAVVQPVEHHHNKPWVGAQAECQDLAHPPVRLGHGLPPALLRLAPRGLRQPAARSRRGPLPGQEQPATAAGPLRRHRGCSRRWGLPLSPRAP